MTSHTWGLLNVCHDASWLHYHNMYQHNDDDDRRVDEVNASLPGRGHVSPMRWLLEKVRSTSVEIED